jgi:hypothetical protein
MAFKNFGRPCSPASERALFTVRRGGCAMPSKVVTPAFPAVSVKKLVLELDADSTSFVTLRVKRDRRQFQLDVPNVMDRRGLKEHTLSSK